MSTPTLGRLYRRIAGDRFVKGLAGFRGRRLVKARALLPRRLQPTLRLKRDGLCLRVTSDPLDVRIVRAVTGTHRSVFFPPEVADPAGVGLVLDLGAHHGVYTAVAAREYPQARIIAVEPALDALVALRAQVTDNRIGDRVEIVPAALADRAGVAVLAHEGSGSWGATLHQPESVTVTERVATLTLEEIIGDRELDVVKSNAEGGEFALVTQLEQRSVRPGVVVMAVHPDFGDVDVLRDRMAAMGYAVRVGLDGDHPIWICAR